MTASDRARAEELNAQGLAKITADPAGATVAFQAAITADPGFVKAYVNLANMLRRAGDLGAAEGLLDQALRLDPGSPRVLAALGNVLAARGRYAGALDAYDASLAGAESEAVHASSAAVYARIGATRQARAELLRAGSASANGAIAQLIDAWETGGPRLRTAAKGFSDVSWLQAALIESTEDEARFSAMFGWAEPVRTDPVDLDPERMLKIGYLTDAGSTELSSLFSDAVAGYEVHHFVSFDRPERDEPDPPSNAHATHDVSRFGSRELAEAIAAQRIDVLVDLTGYRDRSRLRCLAYRPAPVQMTRAHPWPSTLPTVDHSIDEAFRVETLGHALSSGETMGHGLARACRAAWRAYVAGVRGATRARLDERLTVLDDGQRIFTPASLSVISTVVFAEQRKWFEDEIAAIDLFVEPGQTACDIGANFGAYSLALARAVGATGHVLAFEPAWATASTLRRSVASNGLSERVRIEQAAVGREESTAVLSHRASPESHSLLPGAVRPDAASDDAERVQVTTLDRFARELAGLSFLKIDAEGSEAAILRSSGALIARLSPLVLFELRHGNAIATEVLDTFVDLGFELFSFCPPLEALVPLSTTASGVRTTQLDSFVLNAFAVTPTRAEALERAGRCLRRVDGASGSPADPAAVAAALKQRGLGWMPAGGSEALAWLVASEDREAPLARRWLALERAADAALEESRSGRMELQLQAARILRLASRRDAIAPIVDPIVGQDVADLAPRLRHAFLPALASYDAIEPRPDGVHRWMLAQAIAAHAAYCHRSICYTSPRLTEVLRRFPSLGYADTVTLRSYGLLFGCAGTLE